jgi:hypothetical protein
MRPAPRRSAMPEIFLVFSTLPSALFAVGAAIFLRARRMDSVVLRFMAALGWIGLCTLPAVLVQGITLVATGRHGIEGLQALQMSLVSWWVLAGGSSVIAVIEASAKAISGHRQATMLDNWPWFWALLSMQCALLIYLLWPTLGPKFNWKRTRLLQVSAVLLLNSLTAIHWPWWGT